MTRVMMPTRVAALAAMLFVLPLTVLAQTQQSGREDNIWGGKDHQPTQSEVSQEEQSEGIGLPQQNQQRENDEVESLYQTLIQSGTQSH
jgi:hypothetical protein